MVKSVIDGVTTYYVGGYYELIIENTDETEVKYYMAAGRRIAMRTVTDTTNTLHWLISDHLSSTTIISDESGTIVSEMKYSAFGEIRDINGSSPTDYLYTGQRKEVEFGLSYYVARWYDSSTGHFTSADTIIPAPGVSGAWDRYAYVLNNPLKYIDPSGHVTDNPFDDHLLDGERGIPRNYGSRKAEYKSTYSGDDEWDYNYNNGYYLSPAYDEQCLRQQAGNDCGVESLGMVYCFGSQGSIQFDSQLIGDTITGFWGRYPFEQFLMFDDAMGATLPGGIVNTFNYSKLTEQAGIEGYARVELSATFERIREALHETEFVVTVLTADFSNNPPWMHLSNVAGYSYDLQTIYVADPSTGSLRKETASDFMSHSQNGFGVMITYHITTP